MTDVTDETAKTAPTAEVPSTEAQAPKVKNKHVRTLVFAGLLIGVVALFQILTVLADPPPDLPRDVPHTLMINNQGELIGIGDPAAWPTTDAEGKEYPMDKKAIARRVNFSCTHCHGAPAGLRDEEFGAQKNCAVPTKCLPTHETHPQKTTCIKCHRMPGRGKL